MESAPLEETIYANSGADGESPSTEELHIVSDKVHNLANNIYQEFELMIEQYGQDVVHNLMPLVVGILESMDQLYTEKHEIDIELELVKEDNTQLMNQYEREKGLRKVADEKILKVEDGFDEEKKDMSGKVESLESIVRMLELKSKNANDHVSRLEEKETEMKKENQRLHDKYTELFRNHMDYLERAKMMQQSFHGDNGQHGGHHGGRPPAPGTVTGARTQIVVLRSTSTGGAVGEERDRGCSVESTEEGTHGGAEISIKDEMDSIMSDKRRVMSHIVDTTPELTAAQVDQSLSTRPAELDSTLDGNRDSDFGAVSGNMVFDEMTMPDADVMSDEGEPPADDQDFDSEFGMSREIENLINENMELVETKNALNIVKDDLITKVDDLTGENDMHRAEISTLTEMKTTMRERIQTLEHEARELRTRIEEFTKKMENRDDEEDSVPMSQRKRFTRIEMARVLMERNQYKERLMELQEAVRWTEMMRASKEHPDLAPKKKASVWSMFNKLFGNSARRGSKAGSEERMKYTTGNDSLASTGSNAGAAVRPFGDPNRRLRDSLGLPEDKGRAYDFLPPNESRAIGGTAVVKETTGGGQRRDTASARSLMRQHDPERVQAYGWSLPAKVQTPFRVPVPIPVYCRPLIEKQSGMKLWCAAGVNLSGTRTRAGDNVVGTSVFYKCPQACPSSASEEVDKLDKQLQVEQGMSSLVWICTTSHSESQVIVIDANQPADFVDSFCIAQSQALCIGSVPGATQSDYDDAEDDSVIVTSSPMKIGALEDQSQSATEQQPYYHVEWVECTPENTTVVSSSGAASGSSGLVQLIPSVDYDQYLLQAMDPLNASVEEFDNDTSITANQTTLEDPTNSSMKASPSSLQPTMWIGCQSGHLYVHSAVANWRKCLHSVKLKDSIPCIAHICGRVFAALADGSVAIFKRRADGEWDLSRYCHVHLGGPHHSVRCLTPILPAQTVWAGYRNHIFVIDAKTLVLKASFEAHPRRESQVRQLCWVGDGVWVSIRLDATLRLYHAFTYQHLQDVDMEPCVGKMIDSSKLGVSLVRITHLLASCDRLWIGTGNGVIASVHFSGTEQSVVQTPDSAGTATAGTTAMSLRSPSFLPLVDMTKAQISFHGHREAIKFFVAVPGKPTRSGTTTAPPNTSSGTTSAGGRQTGVGNKGFPGGLDQLGGSAPASPQKRPDNMLVLSGGEGYVDFRIGPEDEEDRGERMSSMPRERSHLIVWQIQRV